MENRTDEGFRVLLTASGLSPVGFNTISSLKGRVNGIVGVDIDTDSYAQKLCESYYTVPLASDPKYYPVIDKICLEKKINTILPLTIEETVVLKRQEKELNMKGVRLANSNTIQNIEICNDKLLTFRHLKNAGINIPVFSAVSDVDELMQASYKLGYPQRDIVFKPRTTHGSRGFRILTKSHDKLRLLIENKPTDNIYISLEDLVATVAENQIRCIVMDKLDGDDYSVYSFAIDGDPLVVIPMRRLGLVPGMSTGGEAVNNKEIIEYVSKIVSALKLNGSINIQLKLTESGPLLYEINSRISATTVMVRPFKLNFPLYEVLLAHCEHSTIKQEISRADVRWGLTMRRIYQEVYNENGNYFLL